ncbi:MAG: acyltransferase family protein [Eubacteriales bacterium]
MHKRLEYLDIAKGIGILLIVMGHAMLGVPDVILWFTKTFHLPLFYIVSGIVIAHGKEVEQPFLTICKRKCRQLLVPYFIFSFIAIAFVIKEFLMELDNRAYIGVLLVRFIQTFTLSGTSVLWFLPSLLIGELIFIKLLQQISQKSWKIKALSYLLMSLATLVMLYVMVPSKEEFDVTLGWGIYIVESILKTLIRAVIAAFFLMIGYGVEYGRVFVRNKLEKKNRFPLVVAGGIASYVLCNSIATRNTIEDLNRLHVGNPVFFILNAIVGSIFILCFSQLLTYLPIVNRILGYCGKNSLLIMVTHLDLRVFLIGFKVEELVNGLLGGYSHSMTIGIFVMVVVVVEVIYITLVNRYLPFVIGRRRKI